MDSNNNANLVGSLSLYCCAIYMQESGRQVTADALLEAKSLFNPKSNNSEHMDANSSLKWWKYYLNQIPSQDKRIPIFEKVLSFSDCVKPHLVIPKRSKILDFFPNPKDCKNKVEILIEDEGKKYLFHYAYNKSNSTFILKGAWTEFVTQKELQVGDTVTLERDENHKYLITCKRASIDDEVNHNY